MKKYKYNGIFNKVIAISEKDKKYILELNKKYSKMSQAGILSYIINKHKKNCQDN